MVVWEHLITNIALKMFSSFSPKIIDAVITFHAFFACRSPLIKVGYFLSSGALFTAFSFTRHTYVYNMRYYIWKRDETL
jgi:hypothetical protein